MDSSQTSTRDTVEIRDLGLAAALVSLSYALDGTVRNNTGRVYFIFADSYSLQQSIKSYWNNELEVGARSYADAMKSLKNLIYGERY